MRAHTNHHPTHTSCTWKNCLFSSIAHNSCSNVSDTEIPTCRDAASRSPDWTLVIIVQRTLLAAIGSARLANHLHKIKPCIITGCLIVGNELVEAHRRRVATKRNTCPHGRPDTRPATEATHQISRRFCGWKNSQVIYPTKGEEDM
jgi:hypothetical protein